MTNKVFKLLPIFIFYEAEYDLIENENLTDYINWISVFLHSQKTKFSKNWKLKPFLNLLFIKLKLFYDNKLHAFNHSKYVVLPTALIVLDCKRKI